MDLVEHREHLLYQSRYWPNNYGACSAPMPERAENGDLLSPASCRIPWFARARRVNITLAPPQRLWPQGQNPRWPSDATQLYELLTWWSKAKIPKQEWEWCCQDMAKKLGLSHDAYVKVLLGKWTLSEAYAAARRTPLPNKRRKVAGRKSPPPKRRRAAD